MTSKNHEWLQCRRCGSRYETSKTFYLCECRSLLEVKRDEKVSQMLSLDKIDQRLRSRDAIDRSGVWRFREQVFHCEAKDIVSHPEGGTNLYSHPNLSAFAGHEQLTFKHEGQNPTGSFKDRGMTVAVTMAKKLGMTTLACASTGNTSASLASYAGQAGLKAVVFIPKGDVAIGKIAQAIAYGATCLAVRGDFDQAMALVRSAAEQGVIYLVNSINPWRLEGQKTIIWELFQDLKWQAPDWIIVPGGNLGNTAAFGKAITEAWQGGWIGKRPRLATIQAAGASPFYQSFQNNFNELNPVKAETIATAIKIGHPVNYEKAYRSILAHNGIVEVVDDDQILVAKGEIDRWGIGCEPASAASLAGAKKLIAKEIIKPHETVTCILTGNLLKDPDVIMNQGKSAMIDVDPDMAAIEKYL